MDHFLLVDMSPAKPAEVEADFTVTGTAGDAAHPARKPFFYARWQPEAHGSEKPSLNLDLVPTGKPGEACLFFRGKPLAAQKVTFYPPGAAEQELVSDSAGLVHFDDAKPGLYLLVAARYCRLLPKRFGGALYRREHLQSGACLLRAKLCGRAHLQHAG